MKLLNIRETNKRCKAATAALVVGKTYFLSDFGDTGPMVEVVEKSTKVNSAGWPSTVTVKVVDLHNYDGSYYFMGKVTTVNATNLYAEPRLASAAFKFGKRGA